MGMPWQCHGKAMIIHGHALAMPWTAVGMHVNAIAIHGEAKSAVVIAWSYHGNVIDVHGPVRSCHVNATVGHGNECHLPSSCVTMSRSPMAMRGSGLA